MMVAMRAASFLASMGLPSLRRPPQEMEMQASRAGLFSLWQSRHIQKAGLALSHL